MIYARHLLNKDVNYNKNNDNRIRIATGFTIIISTLIRIATLKRTMASELTTVGKIGE
jgi:hypothetical protein